MKHLGYSLARDKGMGHMITEQVSMLHISLLGLTLEVILIIQEGFLCIDKDLSLGHVSLALLSCRYKSFAQRVISQRNCCY